MAEVTDRWERYIAAADGLPEYWYPVLPSTAVRNKPVAHKLLNRNLVLVRHAGRAYALEDRCPHRQVPLSMGSCEFAGHLTCVYHGWTFDVTNGRLVAALTDGPRSPVAGKASVRSFPVEERCGLIWVWLGDGEPVPVEEDIPDELLKPDARIYVDVRTNTGNWRYAAENGFDEAHGKMLHRSSRWVLLKRVSGWNETEIRRSEDRKWLLRYQNAVVDQDDYPGLGRWPRFNFIQRKRKKTAQGSNEHAVSIRLPAILRVRQPGRANWTHYEWYEQIEKNKYQYLVMAVSWVSGWQRLFWWLRYWTYIRLFHHYDFNGQDLQIVPVMPETPPVKLFRPDDSIIAWRKLVEDDARAPRPRLRVAAE